MAKTKAQITSEYHKRAMIAITVRYKKEFVKEFKDSCEKLGITQAEVFRNAMQEIIEKAKI